MLDDDELTQQLQLGQISNLSCTSMIDPILVLHYKYNKISVERLRQLCKSNSSFGMNEPSVKAFNPIKEREYFRLAKSTRSSFLNVVHRCRT